MSDQAADTNHPERRAHHRQRVLKGALVVFGNYSGAYDCMVRNLTEDGAKLAVEPTIDLPTAFELLIPNERRIVPAKTIWRIDGEMGVVFTGPWRPYTHRG